MSDVNLSPVSPTAPLPSPSKLEVLAGIEGQAQTLLERHTGKRRLWFPGEFMPAHPDLGVEADERLVELRRAAATLPAEVRVSLVLNQLTEEGLPHFHRLIATHLPPDSAWSAWNFAWTAEEDRHGCLLRDYVRDTRVVDNLAVDRLQHDYIAAGFDPDWELDPYRLLAYTSLQERATQMAHSGTGKRARPHEPVIADILAAIASDEARHFVFYRDMFEAILEADPSRALCSLLRVMPALAMPGVQIPGFQAMAEVVAEAGIYGPADYRKIVVQLLDYWRIGERSGLDAEGARAQETLMGLPARLKRLIERRARQGAPRRQHVFTFLPRQTGAV